MKTIYIHIGRGKTGTTAIQHFLCEAAPELKHQGLHYIAAAGGENGSGHQNFAKGFINQRPKYMEPPTGVISEREAVRTEINQSSSENLLLSSENFELAEPNRLNEFLQSLDGDYTVKIVLFVRSQDEIAESEYNQMVKLKGEARSFSRYAATIVQTLHYHQTARSWAQTFGARNLICRVYNGHTNTISDFLDCLGISERNQLKDKIDNPHQNKSIGRGALLSIRLLNEIANKDQSLRLNLMDAFADNDAPALHFTPLKAWLYRSQFYLDNLRFSRKYLGRTMIELGGRRYSAKKRRQLMLLSINK